MAITRACFNADRFTFFRCNFQLQYETLRAGYCKGGNCLLDGREHPDLQNMISF